MNLGTVPDWFSVFVNGAVALVAWVGLRHARQDARRAEKRADDAHQQLAEDRERRASAGLARADLVHVTTLLTHHEALLPNVYLRPIDTGEIRAALAALPRESVPRTRALYSEESARRPSRDGVTAELHAEVQRLRALSVTDA
ncbi:hypothetical protein [Cellulomonas sp. NPDC058312]|uniref:hypothetical protein n=1 Tax=Cellulomonas sp. NPDC058312 TaxID=3346441 RepID=UPI0036E7D0EE